MTHVTTVRAAAARLQVSKQRVHQLIAQGEIGTVRIGSTVLVNEQSLTRYETARAGKLGARRGS